MLTCDVLEGHMSSALPHLGNISYRVGRALMFDGKTETFVDDKQADRLLTREYRKGFEITVVVQQQLARPGEPVRTNGWVWRRAESLAPHAQKHGAPNAVHFAVSNSETASPSSLALNGLARNPSP